MTRYAAPPPLLRGPAQPTVHARCIHPEDRASLRPVGGAAVGAAQRAEPAKGQDGNGNPYYLDISAAAGRELRATRGGLTAVTGWSVPAVARAIAVGCFRRCPRQADDGSIYYLVDPGISSARIAAEWLARRATPMTSPVVFDAFRFVHRQCGLPPFEIPDEVADGAALGCLRIGSFSPTEMAAYVTVPEGGGARMRELLRSRIGVMAAKRRLPQDIEVTPQLATIVYPSLSDLPRTSLAKFHDEELTEPNGPALGHAWQCGDSTETACLAAFVSAAASRRPHATQEHMRNIRTFVSVLNRVAPGGTLASVDAVDATMSALCDEPHPEIGESVRDQACRSVLTLARLLVTWRKAVDSEGSGKWDRLIIAQPSDWVGLVSRLKLRFGHLREEGKDRRKDRSDPLADELPAISDAVAFRMEQLAAALEDARAAAALLCLPAGKRLPGALASADTPYVEYRARSTVLELDGDLKPGVQENTWRVWVERDFWFSMRRDLRQTDNGRSAIEAKCRAAEADPAALTGFVHEWMGAKPLVGTQSAELWFVAIAKSGALGSPESMDPRTRRYRTQFLLRHRLSAYVSTPHGLLSSDKGQWSLWRHAARVGRHVVQLEDFGLAMLVSELCFNVQVDSLCRTDDLIQMQQDAGGWKSLERAGGIDIAFSSVRKAAPNRPLPDPEWIPVHPQTFIDMTQVAVAIARADGHDNGLLPTVDHFSKIRWKCPDKAALVLQKNGHALDHGPLNRFLSFLLCGVAVAKLHDIRHASSARQRADGMPFIELMVTLGHIKPEQTSWYSRPTAAMRSASTMMSARRTRAASGLRRIRAQRKATIH